jgi:hypothetical protein
MYQRSCQHAGRFLKCNFYPPLTESIGNYHPVKGVPFHTTRYKSIKGCWSGITNQDFIECNL